MSHEPNLQRPRSRRREYATPLSLLAPTSVAGKLSLTLLVILAMTAVNLGVSRWTASRLQERTSAIRDAFEEQSLLWEIYGRVDAVRRDLRLVTLQGGALSDSALTAVVREGLAIHKRATSGFGSTSAEIADQRLAVRDMTDSLFQDWTREFTARTALGRTTSIRRSSMHERRLFGVLFPRATADAAKRVTAAQRAFAAAAASGSHLTWLVFVASAALSGLILLGLVGGLSPRLRRLERAAARLGAGDLDERVPVDARDELADVALAFNSMAERLSDTLTEHHRTEEALRESESRFRQLFENATDGLYLHDVDGHHLAVNRQACEMLGYAHDELLALRVTDILVGASEEELTQRWRGMSPGEVLSVEALHHRKDGTTLPVDVRVTKLEISSGSVILAAARDLTERRRLEQQLLQSTKLEAVGRLAGGIAHDFNNVLTSIRGHCQLALEDLHQSDPLSRELEEIDRSAERAARLVRQLLAFSRRQILTPSAVRPTDVVEGMRLMLERLIDENVVMSVTADEDVGHVHVDPGQLEQVILNLVINARDAMPQGGDLRLRLRNERITTASRDVSDEIEPGSYICLSVEDDGSGIPTEVLPKIFEPFFTTKPMGKGTGLGLSTVYGIVKQSRGHIDVWSEPGRGTRIDVRLPRVDDEAEHVPARVDIAPEVVATDRLRGRTVLVVEDEEPVRSVLRRALERVGCRVVAVADADAALRHVRGTEAVDLVISDMLLPGLDGGTLGERISSLRPDIPILFMSGHTREDVWDTAVRGAWLQKPFTPDVLVRKVADLLAGA